MTTSYAPLVFIDTETTSLRDDREVWEVAMIRVAETVRTISIFVSDVDLTNADPTSLNVGRFHERHPRHREITTTAPQDPLPNGTWLLSEATVAAKVEQWTRGATLVGAVPSFDAQGLARLIRRYGLCPTWHHRLVCVESLALPLVGWSEDGRPQGLGQVARALDIEHDEASAHTAFGDARLTQRIFEHLVTR